MAKVNMVITLNVGEDVENLIHTHIASGNVKWYSHSAKIIWHFLYK